MWNPEGANQLRASIIGTGLHVPERVVDNEEIAGKLGLDPQQIFRSSGIRRRRWAAPRTKTSSLASIALNQALENARLPPNEIDYLLFGTMTPDRFIPGSSPSVQHELGLNEIPCLDIRATCCNLLYALQIALALIESGKACNVAITCADVQSPWLDLSPESGTTSMLFGDGASAVIVSAEEREPALKILNVELATDGAYIDDLGIRCPGTEFGNSRSNPSTQDQSDYAPRMAGQSVIVNASRRMTAICKTLLDKQELTAAEIRWIVPHQANANLLTQVARSLKFPLDGDGVISVIEDFGNTSSASMGIALDTLRRSGRIQSDDYLLLPAFGAGFTWGAALLQCT